MKQLLLLCSLFIFSIGCKNNPKQEEMVIQETQKSPAELIAEAHGINNWKDVAEIKFTFSVDRDTIKGAGRSWSWMPKQDSVMLSMPNQTIKYSRRNLDSLALRADPAFINDKFWLLIPFQLVWDEGVSISEPTKDVSPISGTGMNKITITYSSEGGYTPGDAYDIFYNDAYVIQEWVFRKSNSPEPTLATTFEDYADFNGIKLALSHKRSEGNWNLKFRDVKVTLE